MMRQPAMTVAGGPSSNMRLWDGERVLVEVHRRIPDAWLRSHELGPMRLLSIRSGEATISRLSQDAAESRARAFTFIFMLSGEGTLDHYGRRVKLRAGDLTLCDNSVPYVLHFEAGGEAILLRAPIGIIKEHLPTPDCFCGHRLEGRDGLTSVATAMAREIARRLEGALDAESREHAAGYLMTVIASAYATTLGHLIPVSPVMTGRLWKVKLHVEQQLRDPHLSPSRVAQQLKLSDRYLRIVFAANNESLSAYILRRRLEESAKQLQDARWRGQSITQIAFGWGFNSAPHFARRFRERFGMSPRDYRQQAVGPHDSVQ